MSVQRAQELARAVSSDETLRSRLMSATTPDEKKKTLADAGFGDVSKEDVEAARSQSGELSEDELGKASGAGEIRDAYDDSKYIAEDVYDEVSSWFDW